MKTKLSILARMLVVMGLVITIGACSSDNGTNPPVTPKVLTLALDPSPVFLGAGSSAIIKVKVTNADKLVSWHAVITFDPTKLNISGLKIREITDHL
ncbi:MAG: hypothetical protein NTX15_02780, partial [Candidatus Kapabacteria bacterium]|nr:hypothetical protein [Candidatus Kapabacteria bacterium]